MTGMAGPIQTRALDDLAQLAGELLRVLQSETAGLVRLAPNALADLTKVKMALTSAFAQSLSAIRGDPALLGAQSPAARGELRAVVENVIRAAADNARALAAARDVNQRLLEHVVDAAERRRPVAAGYGRTGRMARAANSAARPVSLFANQCM